MLGEGKVSTPYAESAAPREASPNSAFAGDVRCRRPSAGAEELISMAFSLICSSFDGCPPAAGVAIDTYLRPQTNQTQSIEKRIPVSQF